MWDAGSQVTFRHPERSWVLGKIDRVEAKQDRATFWCTADESAGKQVAVQSQKDGAGWKHIHPARPDMFDEEPDDLLRLTELHEATLLHCLRRRFEHDVVYTHIGALIVAVNPFKTIARYQPDVALSKYLSEGPVISGQAPHIWSVAHQSYFELVNDGSDQTILISGESGSGKTVGAKIVLDYLTAVSCQAASQAQRADTEAIGARLRAASPILESFGNAKTVRNDNSSRFGKFMRVQFDSKGFLVGAHTTKYLLEKSRILSAAHNERVYHIFYQVLTDPSLASLGLVGGPQAFRNTHSGHCPTIDGVDDSEAYAECRIAMGEVGIPTGVQGSILRATAGIMLLQNVEFGEAETAQDDPKAVIDAANVEKLRLACNALGIDPVALQKELLTTKTVIGGETVEKALSKVRACDVRDSIAKQLYDRLFQWLVDRINQTTDKRGEQQNWLGLLDIFGFEQFEHNSFEQLCINLANEALQNHYNSYVFVEDMEDCRAEGIDTAAIDFADNQPALDLIRKGVLALLDESCNLDETDEKFLDKCHHRFGPQGQGKSATDGHEAYGIPRITRGSRQDPNSFIIKHYAGEVIYSVRGWLDKNKEPLKDEIRVICGKSSDPIVSSLLPAPEPQKGGKSATVSAVFRAQVADLIKEIRATNPHWIRCIKPHPAKQPRLWDPVRVMEQLASAGVLETVRVRRAGYPIRYKQRSFVEKFGMLAGKVDGDPASVCKQVLQALKITAEGGQIGKTKVFLRPPAFAVLTEARESCQAVHLRRLQRVLRGHGGRAWVFLEYVRSHKDRLARERAERLERERREQELLRAKREREHREHQDREAALRREVDSAAAVIQRRVRGVLTRAQLQRDLAERMRAMTERYFEEKIERQHAEMLELDRVRREAEAATERASRNRLTEAQKLRRLQEQRALRDEALRAHAAARARRQGEEAGAAAREAREHAALLRRVAAQQREEKELRMKDHAARCAAERRRREEADAVPRRRKTVAPGRTSAEIAAGAMQRFASARAAETKAVGRRLPPAHEEVCRRYEAMAEWESTREQVLLSTMRRERERERELHVRRELDDWGLSVPPRPLPSFNSLSSAQARQERLYQQRIASRLSAAPVDGRRAGS